MSESALPHQHINDVSTQNHSQAFVGSARDVCFTGPHEHQDTPEEAALKCRHALYLTDPEEIRERVISAKGARVEGTCEWVTHDAKYLAWLNSNCDGVENGNTRLLWISGGPGKGKTMLSIFLTEELQRQIALKDTADLVFFFCSADDKDRNTAVAVLRGLVHQIITKQPRVTKHALPYFETPERTQQTLSSFETLWIIFNKIVTDAELRELFCVINGLDECEESTMRVFLPRITTLITRMTPSSSKSSFRLIIVSREMIGLHKCTPIRIDPDNDDNVNTDIERFISVRVAELSAIEGFTEAFGAAVQSALLRRAERTFLWVGFAMHELMQKQTCSEIWTALEELPSGLPAIYSRMLSRIPNDQRQTSRTILQWITMAIEDLHLDQVTAIAQIKPASPLITMEQAARDAIALCGPMLKVAWDSKRVYLIHQSVRDYLFREHYDNDGRLEFFRFEQKCLHLEMTRTCIQYVEQSGLQHRFIDFRVEGSPELPLLPYAMRHWPYHLQRSCEFAAEFISSSEFFIRERCSLRDNWYRAFSVWVQPGRPPLPLPLLHMACSLQITSWVEVVLTEMSRTPLKHRLDIRDDVKGWTALHIAVLRNNIALARLLLDSGADINTISRYSETTPFQYASEHEDTTMMLLLLDRGADIHAMDKKGNTALHMAATYGYDAVLKVVLDRGADIYAINRSGSTALHAATSVLAITGNLKAAVQVLLDRGAELNARDYEGKTALHYAAINKNAAVARLLLDKGADIHARDHKGKKALDHARRRGPVGQLLRMQRQ